MDNVKIGGLADVNPGQAQMLVNDRDLAGVAVSTHNASGFSGWTPPDAYAQRCAAGAPPSSTTFANTYVNSRFAAETVPGSGVISDGYNAISRGGSYDPKPAQWSSGASQSHVAGLSMVHTMGGTIGTNGPWTPLPNGPVTGVSLGFSTAGGSSCQNPCSDLGHLYLIVHISGNPYLVQGGDVGGDLMFTQFTQSSDNPTVDISGYLNLNTVTSSINSAVANYNSDPAGYGYLFDNSNTLAAALMESLGLNQTQISALITILELKDHNKYTAYGWSLGLANILRRMRGSRPVHLPGRGNGGDGLPNPPGYDSGPTFPVFDSSWVCDIPSARSQNSSCGGGHFVPPLIPYNPQ